MKLLNNYDSINNYLTYDLGCVQHTSKVKRRAIQTRS